MYFSQITPTPRYPRLMRFIDREEVSRRLTYDVCIPIVRDAMIALSSGETLQHLRTILPLSDGRLFGIMPGALGPHAPFGAKLISVFHENFAKGIQSHQGLVLLFDPESGAPVCVVHAGEITAIRTAAASAAATDALARPEVARLAILGYGEQAATHARAISHVRKLESITVWGRDKTRAAAFAARTQSELGIPVTAALDVESAVWPIPWPSIKTMRGASSSPYQVGAKGPLARIPSTSGVSSRPKLGA